MNALVTWHSASKNLRVLVGFRFTIAIVGVIAWIVYPLSARAQANANRGLKIASQWCNSCHMVQQNDPGADDAEAAPRFSTLTTQTAQSLKRLLAAGHADMDALSKLSDSDIADIAAHLHRLKPEPSTR